MATLKERVRDETSLTNRIAYNSRRLRLAGLGLMAHVDSGRIELYRHLMQAGQGAGDESSLAGVISILGAGASKLMRERAQQIFEELVAAGERASTPPTLHEVTTESQHQAFPSVRTKLVVPARQNMETPKGESWSHETTNAGGGRTKGAIAKKSIVKEPVAKEPVANEVIAKDANVKNASVASAKGTIPKQASAKAVRTKESAVKKQVAKSEIVQPETAAAPSVSRRARKVERLD
ncbi:Hypothetical protein HDN1F_11150 [gamma proteobacterium HdN1]|nr:Hypothetical protein HDN1F_11150 [gamma proteobacterium HdN1]